MIRLTHNRFVINANGGPCREYDRKPSEFSDEEKSMLRAVGSITRKMLARFIAVLDGTAFASGSSARLVENTTGPVPNANFDGHNAAKIETLTNTISNRIKGLIELYLLRKIGSATPQGAPVIDLITSTANFRFGGSEKGPNNIAHLIDISYDELEKIGFGIDDQQIVSVAKPPHKIPGSKPEPKKETQNEKQIRVTLKRNEFVRTVLQIIDSKLAPFLQELRVRYHNPSGKPSTDQNIGYLRCVYELMPNGDLKISLLRSCNPIMRHDLRYNYSGKSVGIFFRKHCTERGEPENATTTNLYE